MSRPVIRIKDDFLDGMDEVFSTLFNNKVKLYLMDDEQTVPDELYGETPDKVYKEPISLVARVVTSFTKEEIPEMDMKIDAVITVPTKQFIKNNLPRETWADLKTLARGYISYKEIEHYSIVKVQSKTLVDDEWQFYDFYCYVPKEVWGRVADMD